MHKRVVLHIGPPKTGSTSLQAFCHGFRFRLLERGLFYPPGRWQPELGSFLESDKPSFIYNALSNSGSLEEIEARDAFFIAVLDERLAVATFDTAIFSYEGFFDLSAEAVHRLRDFLGERFSTLEVVFYCRNPLSFARSYLAQHAIMGFPGAETAGPPPVLAYSRAIPPFIEAFGRENVRARPFAKPLLRQGSIIPDFFHTIGRPQFFEGLNWQQFDAFNASVSAMGVRLAKTIKSNLPKAADSTAFRGSFGLFLQRVGGPPVTLSQAQEKTIEEQSKPHTDFLKEEFGIDLTEATAMARDELEERGAAGEETLQALAEEIIAIVSTVPDGLDLKERTTILLKHVDEMDERLKAIGVP